MTMPLEQVYREVATAVNRAIESTGFFEEALDRCAANGVRVKGIDLVISVEHWVGCPQTSDDQFLRSMGIQPEQKAPSAASPLLMTVQTQQRPQPGRIAKAFRCLVKAFSISPDES